MQGWAALRDWLRKPSADFLLDEAVMGSLPAYEAEEILVDYGIPATAANLRRFGVEINAALSSC